MIGAQALVVDTIDDGVVGAGGRGRDQHALGAGLKVLRGGVTAGEAAGALHDDIDVKLAPRQLGRIGLGGHLDCATVEHNAVAIDLDRPREATVDGIVLEQVRVGFDRRKVIDRDDLNIRAARFLDRAQNTAANAAKPVDRYPNGHAFLQLVPGPGRASR